MTKVLLISLSNDKEIIESSFLINSLKKQNPHKEISILTYSDLSPIANLLVGIENIYTINRNEITNLFENKLFSQGFAINKFFDDLEKVSKTQWNEIINYSNNNITTYLATYLEKDQVYGTTFTNNLLKNWSCEWEAYECFYERNYQSPIPSSFTKHFINNTHFFTEGSRLKINSDFNSIATENFKRIRRNKGENSCYIVGISLMKNTSSNRLDIQSLVQMIETLDQSKHYKPVLILGTEAPDKEICNQLNSKFNNQLISITADSDAITSVVSNIDILISTNNIHVNIAQALHIPTIEVIESDAITTINMANSYYIRSNVLKFHDEVAYILNNIFENELPVESISNQSKVYQSICDEYSTYYTQISGELDVQNELRYHVSRAYHFELMGESMNRELLSHIAIHSDRTELLNFIDYNKDELTKCVKSLLATLRSLKGLQQSDDNKRNFVQYLDQLLSYANSKSLVNAPILIFAGKIENLQSTSVEFNLKEIESLLFNLKNKLQKLTNIFEVLIGQEKINTKDNIAQ